MLGRGQYEILYEYGWTALMEAVKPQTRRARGRARREYCAEMVRLLGDAGADANKQTEEVEDGGTALFLASEAGEHGEAMIRMLVDILSACACD